MMMLPYDAKVFRDLATELDRWKAQLDYRGPIRRAWAGRLRRDLEAEAVAASTSMEGVPALDLRERVQQRIWTAVEEAVAAAGLEPRVANAVWDVFFGRSVTSRYYRPLADVSPATATTDLAAAVAAGLLRPHGKARSRRYLAGDGLYPRIGTALGVPVDAPGEPARAIIIGELTKRVVSERPR